MMNKEDFHENQLVVRVDHNTERGNTFFTVIEVHESHLVIMHPRYGLDAVFFENPRTTYSPATREELETAKDETLNEITVLRQKTVQKEEKVTQLRRAIFLLDETNR